MEFVASIFELSPLIGVVGGLLSSVGAIGFLFWSVEHTKDVPPLLDKKPSTIVMSLFCGSLVLCTGTILLTSGLPTADLPPVWTVLPIIILLFFIVLYYLIRQSLERAEISVHERQVALRYNRLFTAVGVVASAFLIYRTLGMTGEMGTTWVLCPLLPIFCTMPEISRLHRASIRKHETSNHSLILGEGNT